MTEKQPTLRTTLYRQMVPSAWLGKGLSPFNRILAVTILLSVLVVILETEPMLTDIASGLFRALNFAFAALFTIEYALRLWVMGCDPQYSGARGRLRFIFSPAALIDILAIVPFYLSLGANHGFILRLVRVLRILTLARLGRFSEAYRILWSAVCARRFEILIAFGIAGTVIVFSASIMFLAERTAHPKLLAAFRGPCGGPLSVSPPLVTVMCIRLPLSARFLPVSQLWQPLA